MGPTVATMALLLAGALPAQSPAGVTWDDSLPTANNYAVAQFRLWLPAEVGRVRAALVLVPGSNGDGRGQVADTVWQAFAVRHHLALLGVRLTDRPHDQGFIEEYVDASAGSGQALLDVLARFAATSHHPELAGTPLLLWGMSAGGEYNYEFTAWRPERVIAFVVNKGNIYYHMLLSKEARAVPGMLFTGGSDLKFRRDAVAGLFAVNRRGGALWAFAEEPGAGHVVGKSRDIALPFFEDVMALRLGDNTTADGLTVLKPLTELGGWLADLGTTEFVHFTDGRAPSAPTAWLPSERVAKAWQAMVRGASIAH
jgi:poly(3-hydroxybutyrate) depolymerase